VIAAATAPMTSSVEPTLTFTCSTLAGCGGGPSPVMAAIVDRWPWVTETVNETVKRTIEGLALS
jgi:hypothetical protein